MDCCSVDSRHRLLWIVVVGLVLFATWAGAAMPAHAASCTYRVQSGDTLSEIAREFNTSVARLAIANGITNVNLIYVDQQLTIPACERQSAPVETIRFPRFLRQSTIDLSPVPQAAPLPSDVEGMARSAAVRLLVTGLGSIFQGTGSVVGENGDMILTAYHVVARPLTRQLRGDMIQLDTPDELAAELVETLPERDLALLRLTTANTKALPAVPLGDSDDLRIGDTLYVVGYPAKLEGKLSSEGGVVIDLLSTEEELRYIVTDGYAGQGSSGGLAINQAGELVGIIDALLTDPEVLEALGYPQLDRATVIIPISQALPLLNESSNSSTPG